MKGAVRRRPWVGEMCGTKNNVTFTTNTVQYINLVEEKIK